MKRPLFSLRTAWDLRENPIAEVHSGMRANGKRILDLCESNPTRVKIFQSDKLIALLGHLRGAVYEPLPFGHPDAREAICAYYKERGFNVPAENTLVCASTSEGYSFLFKLLCNPGDRVLVPMPSYPLLEHLAQLEGVELIGYPLLREMGFGIDVDALKDYARDERVRAIVMVHPNNPTGTFVRRADALAVEELAASLGIALIVDEVFGDYAHEPLSESRLASFAGRAGALTFVLSGISKIIAMPQLKLGWIAVSGPSEAVKESLSRLEMIADTFLSVNTPVQRALPELLAARAEIQKAVLSRVTGNLAVLDGAILAEGGTSAVRRLPMDGGWYAILEVPRTQSDESWVELFLREEGIFVHPGYFFDMDREGFLVLSLLPEPEIFAEAVGRLSDRLGRGE